MRVQNIAQQQLGARVDDLEIQLEIGITPMPKSSKPGRRMLDRHWLTATRSGFDSRFMDFEVVLLPRLETAVHLHHGKAGARELYCGSRSKMAYMRVAT